MTRGSTPAAGGGAARGRLGAGWRVAIWSAAVACAAACGADARHSVASGREAARAAPEPSSAPPLALESIPPVPAARLTAEQRSGRALYDAFCWTCHGRYGHGDGPAARGFRERLPELSRVAAVWSVDEIVRRLRQPATGVGAESGPPVWHALGPDEIRAAVAYVRTFARPGRQGNPAAGRLIYATYCVHCHGSRGAGDGRLALALTRPPSPADLRKLDLPAGADRVFAELKTGKPPQHGNFMPRWGRVFDDAQLWDVIAYLEVLAASRRI